MKYRDERGVMVDAMRFTAETLDECLAFCGGSYNYRNLAAGPPYGEVIEVETRDGKARVVVGDWIIKGAKGAIYVSKPDIFAATALRAAPEPEPDLEMAARVRRLAESFAREWLRPDNPDQATQALVDPLSTVMVAFYAAARSLFERRRAADAPAPLAPGDK